ncbi:MAG: hypothetical protein LBK44_01260, partial [Spirochaetales bacterium]|nr:hypothetical protein [Spirochaetales bacterium]
MYSITSRKEEQGKKTERQDKRHVSGASPAQRGGRAFRYKSSEAPMRFLWAFRYNPLRGGSSRQGPAIAGARNCHAQVNARASVFLIMRLPGLVEKLH